MGEYNKLKVTELKELLKVRGIASTGLSRKQQIVEALEAHDVRNGDAESAEKGSDGEEQMGEEVADPQPANPQDGGEDKAKVGEVLAVAEAAAAETAEGMELARTEAQGTGDTMAEDEELAPPVVEDTRGEVNATTQDLPADVTVMEKNEPVSKEPSSFTTPLPRSPAAESQSSETRKRKRRSPTPPLSAASVSKKLKSGEEEAVKLPEDTLVENDPMPIEQVGGMEEANVDVPYGGSDDLTEMAEKATPSAQPLHDSRMDMDVDGDVPSLEEENKRSTPPDTTMQDTATTTTPAIHPATRSLYIRDLVRPLQPPQLRSHLLNLATLQTPTGDPRVIETFHLDTLRTHAFVTFTTPTAASRTRAHLHATIWPDEPSRKPLSVDFVPDEKVQDWIDVEVNAGGGGRRDAKKWEVVYGTTEGGDVSAELQEIPFQPPSGPAAAAAGGGGGGGTMRQQSFSGQGMPNAPLGPRADRPSTQQHQKPTPAPAVNTASFDILDARFNSTTTKPKLYHLPVSAALVTKRLEALDAITSRDWDNGRVRGGEGGGGQLRRYTFEDGERVVDNGPDIGHFGRVGGGGGFRGGGGQVRGRGGGGGYRGRW